MIRWIIFFVMGMSMASSVLANDLSIRVNVDPELYTGVSYDKLFRISNLNKSVGMAFDVHGGYSLERLTVVSNLVNGSNDTYFEESYWQTILNETFVLDEINSWKTKGTGSLFFEEGGEYRLQGWVEDDYVNDSDDEIDLEIFVVDVSGIPCNISLNMSVNGDFFNESESIKFKHGVFYDNGSAVKDIPFVISYWVEDLFGEVYKKQVNSTNTNQKSWKTKIKESDRVLFVKSMAYPLCKDIDMTDNEVAHRFIVKGDAISPSTISSSDADLVDASMEITKVSELSFGKPGTVTLDIQKGDTRKYSVSVQVIADGKKISDISKVQVREKYGTFSGSVSIFVPCKEVVGPTPAMVLVEGLDMEDSYPLTVLPGKCGDFTKETCEVVTTTSASKPKFIDDTATQEYSLINSLLCSDRVAYIEQIHTSDVFSSWIGLILLFVMVLFCVVVLFK